MWQIMEDENIECHMRLGIDVRQADQQIRSTVVLPAGLGKEVRVCVIAKGAKATEATEAGADFAGADRNHLYSFALQGI